MRTTVVIPTYNERENIAPLIDALLALPAPDLSVLVVDDSSPDGTADVVRARTQDPRVRLLLRPHKDGLGRAYTAAFQRLRFGGAAAGDALNKDSPGPATPDAPSGLRGASGQGVERSETSERRVPEPGTLGPARKARGAGEPGPGLRQDPLPPDVIIQMDADFSHNPADIPRLLAALETADLVIGSRYVPRGRTLNWNLGRRVLSRAANAIASSAAGVPIRDLTGGFNAWRAPALASARPEQIRAEGYGYLVELKVRAARRALRVAEIPITFTERRGGQSKLSRRVIWEAAGVVLKLALQRVRTMKNALVPAAFLALFVAALLFPYFLSGFLLTGDLRDVFIPLEDFYRTELGAGRLPTWDPATALGFPVLASAQIGFWYPPLFALRFLPPELAFAVAYLGHSLLLAFGMARYGRSLGLSRAAALLAALAFTGSGFVVGHLTHANIVFGVAWLPWALLVADRLARTLRSRWGVILSMIVALIALTGHFQIALLVLGFCAVRALGQLRHTHAGVPWTHTLWTGALLLLPTALGVVLLSAAQLFPTLELLRVSSRGVGGGFDIAQANQHSFPPWQLVSFLLPAFYGFPDLSEYFGKRPLIEMAAWVGTVPLLLAFLGATANAKFQNPNVKRRVRIWRLAFGIWSFWTATAVVGLALALGSWSPFRLIGIEPTFGIFSSPARYLLLTEFALAILAGFGLDLVKHNGLTARRTVSRAVGVFGLGAALTVVAGFFLFQARPESLRRPLEFAADRFILGRPGHVLPREAYLEKIGVLTERLRTWGVNQKNPLILVSTVSLGVGGALLVRRGRLLVPLLLGLTGVELLAVSWAVHPRVPWPEVFRPSPVLRTLRERPWGRLFVIHPPGDTGLLFANRTTTSRDEHERLLRDLAVANVPSRAGIPTVAWPAALDLADAARVLGTLRDELGRPVSENLLDRLSIRYIAGSTATPDLVPQVKGLEILSTPSGDGDTIHVWERSTTRPRAEVFTETPTNIQGLLPPLAGRVTIAADSPQRVSLTVENTTGRDATLVLRDTLYPGWIATVDSVGTPIDRADTLFRGVRVPPGTHAVTFNYRPWPARLGIAVSAASWGAALVVLARKRPVGTI